MMSNRIPPQDGEVPEYREIPRSPKRSSKKALAVLTSPPATIKASRTGYLTDEMMNDKEALLKYLKFHAREIAGELARKNGAVGVRASDVRIEGALRGFWINKQFKGREFSFLSGMFRSMGLICTERQDISDIPTARNDNHYWVLPIYAKRVG